MTTELVLDKVPDNAVAAYRQLFDVPLDEPLYPLLYRIDLNNLPKPDFSHSKSHIECVQSFSKPMVKALDIDEYWKTVIKVAIDYHDIDQGYSLHRDLPQGPHREVAAVIAYMLTKNRDVANVIWLHNEDDLSVVNDSRLVTASRITKNADQMDLTDYRGIIRLSPYWGCNLQEFQKDSDQILSEMELCDPRCNEYTGLPSDYGLKVRRFCLTNIFPFLVETGQVEKARSLAHANVERYFGSTKRDIHFLQMILDSNQIDAVQRGNFELSRRKWMNLYGSVVEGLDERYARLFIRKPLLDIEILEICEKINFHLQTYSTKEANINISELLKKEVETNPWSE